jgi:hypothetical protein
MTFVTISRSILSRCLVVLIVALVISPYTAPFATLDGADFGGAAAVDLGTPSKAKTDSQAGLVAPVLALIAAVPLLTLTTRPIVETPRSPRLAQHAVLRL